MATVQALWAEAWARILEAFPDAEDRLRSLPHAVGELEASAARWCGRVVREETEIIEAEAKVAEWADAVLEALARQDHARSERLCSDCGAVDVSTVAPGLTGGRVCSKCLREAAA
jgi:hypothetical protein